MPSAVFIGFAGSDDDISAGQRGALEASLTAAGLPEPELSLPVATGLVLCFDYPTRTLEFVRRLGALARRDDWPLPALRMGVHVATVIRNAGASDTTMSSGSMDGAMRVARFAAPNQALATPPFQTLVVQLLKIGTEHFRDLGRLTGKDGKSVAVFEIIPFSSHVGAPTKTLPSPPEQKWSDAWLADAERVLAEEIGPFAKLLVRQTAATAQTRDELVLTLGTSIADETRRRAFVAALSTN